MLTPEEEGRLLGINRFSRDDRRVDPDPAFRLQRSGLRMYDLLDYSLAARGIVPIQGRVIPLPTYTEGKLRTRGAIVAYGLTTLGVWEREDDTDGYEERIFTRIDEDESGSPAKTKVLKIISSFQQNNVDQTTIHFGSLMVPQMQSADYLGDELAHVAYLDLSRIGVRPTLQLRKFDPIGRFIEKPVPSYPMDLSERIIDWLNVVRKYTSFYREDGVSWHEAKWYQEAYGADSPQFKAYTTEKLKGKKMAVINKEVSFEKNTPHLYVNPDELKLRVEVPQREGPAYVMTSTFPRRVESMGIRERLINPGSKASWIKTEELLAGISFNITSHGIAYSKKIR